MRLAVSGRSGQVATALAERTPPGAVLVPVGRPEFDLADPVNAEAAFAAARPDAIVSAAAYTAVDKAESEADLAFRVNVAGAGAVAAAAAALGVPLIHLSTDYVFDGSRDGEWSEADAPSPLGVYGASKLAGEAAVLAATDDAAILRIAWVYAPFGANFVRTMLRLAGTRDRLGVVDDQVGRPTSALDIADALWRVAADLGAEPDDDRRRGVFHVPPDGPPASWADFAEAIFMRLEAETGRRPVVDRIATSDYPTPARRPANSLLDGTKFSQAYGFHLPDWRKSLDATLDRLIRA